MKALIVGVSLLALTTPAAMAQMQATPAPSATAAENTQNFLVFFDWAKDTLTPEARQIIADAASRFNNTGQARITVVGHTDLSGPADYNQRLSERRADAVAQELISLGVPADVITAFGEGENNPLVPTADGVREPQNRRVEIIMPVAASAPVAEAPPPPPAAAPAPPPPLRWAFGLGAWYGYNLRETDANDDLTSQLLGPQLTAEYAITPNWTIGADVAGYTTMDTSADDGYGGRATGLVRYVFNAGAVKPYIGPHAGYITGKGTQDGFVVGPTLGAKIDLSRHMFLYAQAAYDVIPMRNEIDQGIINGSLGAGVRF